jgi:Tfp pilus assembly protein FimT
MTQTQRWMAIVATVAFFAVPGMVSAGDETRIPPEAN